MRASRKSRSDTSSSRAALALFQSLLMKGWPTLSRQSSRSFCTRCAYSGRVIRPVKPRSTEDTVVRLPDTMPMSQVSPPMSVPASRVTVGKIALRGERGQRGVARAPPQPADLSAVLVFGQAGDRVHGLGDGLQRRRRHAAGVDHDFGTLGRRLARHCAESGQKGPGCPAHASGRLLHDDGGNLPAMSRAAPQRLPPVCGRCRGTGPPPRCRGRKPRWAGPRRSARGSPA